MGIFTAWIFGNKSVRNGVFNKLGLTAVFTAVTGFITWFLDLIIESMDDITMHLEALTAAEWPTLDTAGIAEIAGVANALFPMTETITIFSSLYVLWGVVLLVRWIKSFVPTLAG